MNLAEQASTALPGLEWVQVRPRALPTLRPPAMPLNVLRRALKKAKRPVFLVNDDSRVLLDGLGDALGTVWSEAGEPPILVATGTHSPVVAKVRDALGGLPVEVHDADDSASHVELGDNVRIDRRVAEADLIIAFGSVEPHYFAGWTGAHKTATVGVLDRATIAANHEHALSSDARPLALEGNPVFEGLAQILVRLEQGRRLLCVNHVLNERGQPLGVGVGTWRGSLRRAVTTAAPRFVRDVPQPAQVVVAEVLGPLAKSVYQADKGIKNTEACVAEGGHVIVVADLSKGAGPDRFLTLLRAAPDLEAALAHVEREGYVLGDHKAVRLRALQARGVRIHVVSQNLDPATLEGTGLETHATLSDALGTTGATEGSGLFVHDAGVCVARLT